jgi:hypothetical protein
VNEWRNDCIVQIPPPGAHERIVARARASNTDPVGLPCSVVDDFGDSVVWDQCDIRRIMSAFDGGKLVIVAKT